MGFLGISGNQDSRHEADKQSGIATGLRQDAATGYGTVGTEGKSLWDQFQSNLPGLLDKYKTTAGIADNIDTSHLTNPYALTPAQQTQLNTHTDTLNKAMNTAIQNLRKSYADRGINDPRYSAAQEAIVRNLYSGLINEHQANFAEQARQQKQNALQGLMSFFQGLGNTGLGAQETSASGLGNLSSGAQAASNAAQQQQNQNDSNFYGGIGDVLGLGAFGLGGGFSHPSAPTAPTASTGTAPLLGGMGEGSYSNPFNPTNYDLFSNNAPTSNPWTTTTPANPWSVTSVNPWNLGY